MVRFINSGNCLKLLQFSGPIEANMPMQSVRLFDTQLVANLRFIYGSKFSKYFRTLEIECRSHHENEFIVLMDSQNVFGHFPLDSHKVALSVQYIIAQFLFL